MSWVAGSTPLRMSLWTERTQMPSRVAASSALIVSARVEGCDPEPFSKLAHADSRPGLPVGGFASHPVHCHRHLAIRPLTAELADDLHRAGVAIRWVAPSAGARDAQLGMTTAVPVDRHDRLVGRVIAVEYNFPD